jgi:hypothetical protein
MCYTITNFKTKKALKDALAMGHPIEIYNPEHGMGGEAEAPTNGRTCVGGPHYPEPHKWYAEVTVVNGLVTKVK